jgi:hypothetical protein
MNQNNLSEFMDVAQNRTACSPFYNPHLLIGPVQPDKSSILESAATQQEYFKTLILMAGNMKNMIANESKDTENIIVPSPPKRIQASIEVELSSKDIKRRLPKPVIFQDYK